MIGLTGVFVIHHGVGAHSAHNIASAKLFAWLLKSTHALKAIAAFVGSKLN
jgi:hypothetical protein